MGVEPKPSVESRSAVAVDSTPSPSPPPPQQTAAPPPSPIENSDDPAAVWSAVLERALQKPSWAWLRYVQLDRLDAERATLRIVPGHREVQGFATEQRLAQIARVIQDVTGRRVRVTLDRDTPTDAAGAQSTPSAPASSERRDAMGLPLVRQALEIFPEASLIDVREEKPGPSDL